jgi:phospholipase/carboxylesterase
MNVAIPPLARRLGARQADQLIVLLHGVGATAESLAPVANHLLRFRDSTAAVLLEAPQPFDGGESGRQWFSVAGVTEANRAERVVAALPPLWARLDRLVVDEGLDASRLVLLGFSQGAILTLASAALGRSFGTGVALSGRLANAPSPAHAGSPRLLIAHGAEDRVIPSTEGRRAAEQLSKAGFDARFEPRPELGHGVDTDELDRVAAFLG